MDHVKQVWQYVFAEPFKWLFYCFFQPARFKREYEIKGFVRRIVSMLRLALPIFLVSYPVAFIIRLCLHQLFLGLEPFCFCGSGGFVPRPNLMNYWLESAGLTFYGNIFYGTLFGIAGGIGFSRAFGTVFGIATAITFGSTFYGSTSVVEGISYGLMGGIVLGLAFGVAGDIRRSHGFGLVGSAAVIILLIVFGGIMFGIAAPIPYNNAISITLTVGTTATFTIAWGVATANTRSFASAIVGGAGWGAVLGIGLGISNGILWSIGGGVSAAIFASSYVLGHYRLPLYPVSALSTLRTHFVSQRNPLHVFAYLHRSSLYWDELEYLPLPGLKRTLLIAAEQDEKRALEEITFIIAERPQQLRAAREASQEIAVRHLEMCKNLQGIAHAHQRLAEILPQEARLTDQQWVAPFVRLSDASQDAARYCSALGWHTRNDALKDMIENLKKVYPNVAFTAEELNKRLGGVVEAWLKVAWNERERLVQTAGKIGQIDNPYTPGPALELRNSLFVGRHDLAKELEEALSTSHRRPPFLLYGERRMGKSSTLMQLPDLLGARYLPVHFDLQSRGISSSIDTFLGTVAREIYEVMVYRGIRPKELNYKHLLEASRKNEAAVYYVFDTWLRSLTPTLEGENRTVLLAFDEFEKLEEAEQEGFLNLKLLFDWFRSIMQNYPQVALLFSGVRALSDMSPNWAGYFVNLRTLKVSFLRPEEALQLITRPQLDFSGEQIFGERVINEIMSMTAGHPFLIQAICATLISNLNTERRDRANIEDVDRAVNRVLENWWDTYFRDLWERTHEVQRACLQALLSLNKGDRWAIERQTGLEERSAYRALETLLRRDLVVQENGVFQIATPIFSMWVERNRYN